MFLGGQFHKSPHAPAPLSAQYVFLYKVLKIIVQAFSTYYNFFSC
jgi:hypothetical protein